MNTDSSFGSWELYSGASRFHGVRRVSLTVDPETSGAVQLVHGIRDGVPQAVHFTVLEAEAIGGALMAAAAKARTVLGQLCGCGEPIFTLSEVCNSCYVRARRRPRNAPQRTAVPLRLVAGGE